MLGKRFLQNDFASRLCRYPGGQKFRQNHFTSQCFREKYVFAFYAEIQDGRKKKWQESDFCKMLPADSVDTLGVKNFVEIALYCTVSEINEFLRFTQKFKMAAKNGGKVIFAKCRQ